MARPENNERFLVVLNSKLKYFKEKWGNEFNYSHEDWVGLVIFSQELVRGIKPIVVVDSKAWEMLWDIARNIESFNGDDNDPMTIDDIKYFLESSLVLKSIEFLIKNIEEVGVIKGVNNWELLLRIARRLGCLNGEHRAKLIFNDVRLSVEKVLTGDMTIDMILPTPEEALELFV